MDRRTFLGRALPTGLLAVAGLLAESGVASAMPTWERGTRRPITRAFPFRPSTQPAIALVYRGPASTPGCPEAVAALLASAPRPFHPIFCGPNEPVLLTAQTLASATVYAQPGGGELDPAWQAMQPFAGVLRDWVWRGGSYLGFCVGAYLAGQTPGFGLLPGDTDEYVTTAGAAVTTTGDVVLPVAWRGRARHMFFQDGPYFTLQPGARANVLARYTNGLPAALVTRFGSGRVGVVGPHPEADASWYADAGLVNPDGVRFDLGYDLISSTLSA